MPLPLPWLVAAALLTGAGTPAAQQPAPEPAAADRAASDRAASDRAGSRPPNLLLILADDLGAECLGCYGGTSYRTPALDRLAAAGARFSQCHTQPLCTPTRVELLTGLHNARNYRAFSVLPPGTRTIAHALRDRGYRTGAFGKWQLYGAAHYPAGIRGTGTLPEEAGFDRHCLWQVEQLGSRYRAPVLRVDGETRQLDDDAYGPDVCAEALLAFVEREATSGDGAPWFAFWPMLLPHDPFEPPPPSPDAPARGPEHFAAMVAHLDGLVGRVVDRLEQLGIAEHTVVWFLGDNGTSRRVRSQRGGRLVRGGKGLPTRTGTHVPMIAWGPGRIAPGAVPEELVCARDLLPTLVALAGGELPEPVDGHSLVPLLQGGPGPTREALAFWFWPRPVTRPGQGPVRFALDRRWRLFGDGRLFDDAAPSDRPVPADDRSDAAARARERLQRALDELPER